MAPVAAQQIWIWPNIPPAANGWGTKCVVPGLTPGWDLYPSFFTLAQHTPGTPGSIIREPLILGK
jgi:hypothetical protein